MLNQITLELTPLQAECLATLIDAYGNRHSNIITLLDGDSDVMHDMLQEVLQSLPDTIHYYRIVSNHTGNIIGYTTSIADVLLEEPGASFVEISQAEWSNID